MSIIGTYMTLLLGETVPVPAPLNLLEAFDSAEVTHTDEGHSGFQLTFKVGRTSADLLDYPVIESTVLRPGSRMIMIITFNAVPQVLMDGIISDHQFDPGEKPGDAIFTVTGDDVSVMMDMEEKSVEHPAQPESVIVLAILASYAQYGLIPMVTPPPTVDVPMPTERIPVQQGTDLEYLQEMAERFGYVFYIIPGPTPLANTAYWGPPVRVGVPQKAISINMGPDSNATIPSFHYNSLATTFMEGQVQDRLTNQTMPVQTMASTRTPLVSQPAWATQSHTRKRQLRRSGLDTTQAYARAQAETDASTDSTVEIEGDLDAAKYEALLQPRALVDLRGAGYTNDGRYYVKSVTHNIFKGSYTQHFTLTREGTGAISPVVIP